MPPRHEVSPNLEKPYKTARQAIEWYRGLGQSANLYGRSQDLAEAAKLIENSGLEPFIQNRKGEVVKEIPPLLDAACMYAEAAHATSDGETARKYRNEACRVTRELFEDEAQPMSTRVNAKAFFCDWQFADAYDRYSNNEIDYDLFFQRWTELQEYSLKSFIELIKNYDSNAEDVNQATRVFGKAGEWFFLNTHRHQQFVDSLKGKPEDIANIRLAYTREDAALGKTTSANFDVVLEKFNRDRWETDLKFQIKTKAGKDEVAIDCDLDVQPRTLNFPNMKVGFEIMTVDTLAMHKSMLQAFDDRISEDAIKPYVDDAFERVGLVN